MLDTVKKDVSLHLKTARGMIDGIIKMIENDRYCMDVSTQVLSASALLRKANQEILKGHIQTCVRDAFEEDRSDEKIQEIFQIIDKYAR